MATIKKKKLSNLRIKFGSLVDDPAQEHAHVLMVKGKTGGIIKELVANEDLTMLATDEVDGHQHDLYFAADAVAGETDIAGKDETSQHVHAWSLDDNGDIVLAEADGHTHAVDMAKSDDVPADAATTDELAPETSDLVDTVAETLADAAGAIADAIIEASDPTPTTITEPKATKSKEPNMTEVEKQKLQKALVKAQAERDAAVAYSKLSDAEKAAAADATDPVEYTTSAGHALRKSVGSFAIAQAKQIDDLIKTNAVNVSKAREMELMKRVGEEMPAIVGTNLVKLAILDAIDRGITDDATKKAALEVIKGCNGAFSLLTKASGHRNASTTTAAGDARSDLRKHVGAIAAQRKVDYTVALAELSGSDETTRNLMAQIANEDAASRN